MAEASGDVTLVAVLATSCSVALFRVPTLTLYRCRPSEVWAVAARGLAPITGLTTQPEAVCRAMTVIALFVDSNADKAVIVGCVVDGAFNTANSPSADAGWKSDWLL